MLSTRLIAWLLGVTAAAYALSCTDRLDPDTPPDPGRLRVKTLTQALSNNVARVSLFSYDAQGRLSLIIAYQTPDSTVAPVENTSYQYDVQNRLTRVQRTTVRRGSNSETYTYSYNDAGQVFTLSHSPSTFIITPTYTTASQPSGYSKTIQVSGLSANGGGTFTFTGNDLTLVTERFTVTRSGGPAVPVFSSSTSTTYTFDDKINPFYGVFIIPAPGVFGPAPVSGSFGPYYTYYGGIDNLFNLSQNNVLSGGERTYSYTYNSANLPTRRITTLGGASVETLSYAYETY